MRRRLKLQAETIRSLTAPDLRAAVGGFDETVGPYSPYKSCTGCPSLNASCPSEHVSCRPTCDADCTLVTFGK